MKEIKNTDAREGLRNYVCENGACRFGVHGRELGKDIIQLAQAVDDDEDIGDFEL